MSTELRRVRALAAVSLLSLVALTACAPPTADPGESAEETDAAAPAEPEEEAVSGPECLIVDWYIAEDQMKAYYAALSAANAGLDIGVEGGTGLSFTESTYAYTPDFSILVQVSGAEGTGTITGGVTGDYSATENEITTSHDVSDVALSVTVSGITVDGAGLFDSILDSAPINSAPYECGADGPIIQFKTGEGSPTVPMQLTPAA